MIVSFTVGEIVAILGLAVTFAGFFGTILWNLWGKLMDTRKDISDFKLMVAQNYASTATITTLEQRLMKSEERLMTSMTNLTNRIDTILARLDTK